MEAQINDHKATGTIQSGFPQGGVCSAKFWIIAFDHALELINTENTLGQGFADDLCIVMGGRNLRYMQNTLQEVINKLVSWSQAANLEFSPQKTVAMVFAPNHRRIKTKLKINGNLIKTVESTKYLGITIDRNLTWKPHIKQVTQKCLGQMRSLIAHTKSYFGPKPKLLRWVYLSIIKPKLSYASMIWTPYLTKSTLKTLKKLNRLACLSLTPTTRSTPQAALE